VSDEGSSNGLDVTLHEYASGQKLFSRYRLIKTLGRGGMGIVWLAHDEELERDVALKFLPDLVIHDRAVLNDLKRETRRSLELTHKNIVRIYDFVHDDISGCISMEYIDGDTLSNLRADQPCKIFEPDELRDWVSQLCDALDYAHNHARIVHRDLKPTNLLVNQRGDLKVSDFGIARSLSDSVSKLTVHRSKSGTLVYMSPQQLDGERGDHLDDIYSFGATFYELLTSKPPFYSGNVDRQIREKVPPPMTRRRKELEIDGNPIDAEWEETIAKCLAKEPARRPQSVAEVARRLEVPSPKTRRAQQTATKKSKRGPLLAVAVLLVCIAAIGVWYFGFHKPPKQVPSQANAERTREAQGRATYAAGVGGVKVNSSPPGATVTLGHWTKQTPATFDANSGKYPLFIELDGYEPVAREVEATESVLTDLGTITLQRSKSGIDLSTVPPGAKVLQGENSLGVTPLHIEFPSGSTTFVLVLEGYLPREFKAQLTSKELFKPPPVALAKPLPLYGGTIQASQGSVPIAIKLDADLKSGTMTQSSTRGDTVVRFTAVWEGATLIAKTKEVVSQPEGILWEPESFTLRFSETGKAADYECNYGTEIFRAILSAP
jgi:Protein kinase domain/PEGA domain